MGWFFGDAPGHEGYVIGLLEYEPGMFQEIVGPARAKEIAKSLGVHAPTVERREKVVPTHVQAECECGWRSPRVRAPFGAVWEPSTVEMPEHEKEPLRARWLAHLKLDAR